MLNVNSNIDEKLDETHGKILEWPLLTDRERFKRTGQRRLHGSRFIHWEDEAQSRLLWCYGARKLQRLLI